MVFYREMTISCAHNAKAKLILGNQRKEEINLGGYYIVRFLGTL